MDTTRWHIFIYRLPTHPSRARVAVWRELRRLGALPLQQAVVAVPERGSLQQALDAIEARVYQEGGSVYRYWLAPLSTEQNAQLIHDWNQLRTQEYDEIIEECQTKFVREIEFEMFRQNFTLAEAEEIEADLDKIKSWYQRVVERDWFAADRRQAAEAAIVKCERLLDDFVENVYVRESANGPSLDPPLALPWGTVEPGESLQQEPSEP